MQTIEQLIEALQLEPHPEGGFYRSTMRDNEKLILAHGERPLYSSIYFLLRSQDISHLHRLQSDEVWYYHGGSALTIHMIYEDGTYEAKKLGLNIENGEQPQILVEKGTIFGSSVEEENTFGLVGCMVAPGFDFEDFELFTQQQLLEIYPQHEVIIKKMAFEQL
ncbi:cupin domain-containing protein [Solibacillus daqui]|uniref:cupin domain-containing protein n=1 Tax=Solibacillus daqui TaxID=2912187 RepID=UPI002366D048|nr:cupin domain-containing protein [Solibacillus daqui]